MHKLVKRFKADIKVTTYEGYGGNTLATTPLGVVNAILPACNAQDIKDIEKSIKEYKKNAGNYLASG